MKKSIIYLVTVLSIIISSYAVSEEQSLVGIWMLDNNSLVEQIGIGEEWMAQLWTTDLVSYLEVKANGSCTLTYNGQSILADLFPQFIKNDEGYWDSNRQRIYLSNKECKYTLSDDTLIIGLNNLDLKYIRVETDTQIFGQYHENDDGVESADGLEWNILEKRDSTLILISKMGICLSPYSDNDSTDFSDSLVARWLENFYNNAFSEEEKLRMNYICIDDAGNILADKYPNEHMKNKVTIMNSAAHEKYIQYNKNALIVIDFGGTKAYWLNDNLLDRFIYITDNSGNIRFSETYDKAYIRPIICIDIQ